MEVPEYYPRNGSEYDHKIYFGLIPIIIHLIIFVVYGSIVWSVDQDFKYALPDKIQIEKGKGDSQGVFFPLAWVIVLSYTLLCVWFRLFQQNKYKMKVYLWVFAIIALIAIFICAIIYTVTVLSNKSGGTKTIIISAFLVIPFTFFTSSMFYGFWSANGCAFYERHKFKMAAYMAKNKNRKRKYNAQEVHSVEEEKDSGRNLSEVDNERDLPSSNRAQKQEQVEDEGLGMLIPKTTSDWTIAILFWCNFIMLTIFLIVNIFSFTPIWIPFVSYFWILIVQFGCLAVWKYYYSNYNPKKIWFIISIVIVGLCYIAALICFIVGAATEDISSRRNIIMGILLCLHVILVPGIIVYFVVYLPYKNAVNHENKWYIIRRYLLFAIAMIFCITLGVVLMATWGLYASGSGGFVFAAYLILYLLLETKFAKKLIDTKRKKQLLLLAFIIIVTIIVIIVLLVTLENKEEAALEILSFIIYLFLVYFLLRFVEEYKLNQKLMKNQIYIYSYKFMPMLRFKSSGSGAQGVMKENNAEYIYFMICSSQFIFWTLLAGLLLKDKFKYIGFSLSALGFILVYLYIETRMQQGKGFKYHD